MSNTEDMKFIQDICALYERNENQLEQEEVAKHAFTAIKTFVERANWTPVQRAECILGRKLTDSERAFFEPLKEGPIASRTRSKTFLSKK